jgi:hypothetical protein
LRVLERDPQNPARGFVSGAPVFRKILHHLGAGFVAWLLMDGPASFM